MRIDLNCDLGESFGSYTYGADREVAPYITSANIACGFHAGDPSVMRRTMALCREHGVAAGAHPSFPDLLGFGRREMDVTADEVRDYLIYQVGALAAFARAQGTRLVHVKAHGAMYNMAARDPGLARAIAEGVARVDPELILVGLAGSHLLAAGLEAGLAVAAEAFADRAYHPDGSLVSRRQPGAVICDPGLVAARVVEMAGQGTVRCLDGQVITVRPDTICLHGDTPQAALLARAIREALAAAGIAARPLEARALCTRHRDC